MRNVWVCSGCPNKSTTDWGRGSLNSRHSFLMALEAGSLRSRHWYIQCLLRTPFPVHWRCVLAVSSPGGRGKPMCHNYWACALEPTSHTYWAHVPQLLRLHSRAVSHNYWACALEPTSHNYWAHAPQLLRLHSRAVSHNKKSHCNEKPTHHNYWACEPHLPSLAPQLLKPMCLEPMLCNKTSPCNEKPAHRNEE